jgi:hypothetical protein
MENWLIDEGRKSKYWEKILSQSNFARTNLTCSILGLNPDLRRERSAAFNVTTQKCYSTKIYMTLKHISWKK